MNKVVMLVVGMVTTKVEDEDDFDDLEDMIRAFGPEILLKSPKGLENLKMVKKASKETVYGVEKGYQPHWIVQRFVLKLLILKAKYDWLCKHYSLIHKSHDMLICEQCVLTLYRIKK